MHIPGPEATRWRAFSYKGQAYSLDHLHPCKISFQRPAEEGKSAVRFRVELSFSHHCFTRRPRPGETYDPQLIYGHSHDPRLFDFRRWALSKQLPAIIDSLPSRKCRNTGKGNFFTVALEDENGVEVEYEVFFRARKPGNKRITLHVESAYVRELGYGSNRPGGKPIGFYVILHSTLNERPIRI